MAPKSLVHVLKSPAVQVVLLLLALLVGASQWFLHQKNSRSVEKDDRSMLLRAWVDASAQERLDFLKITQHVPQSPTMALPYVDGRVRRKWVERFPLYLTASTVPYRHDPASLYSVVPSREAAGLPRGFRIFVLFEKRFETILMDPWFGELLTALQAHPWVDSVDVWGLGHAGWPYSVGKPGAANVTRMVHEHIRGKKYDVFLYHYFHPAPLPGHRIAPITAIFEHELHCLGGLHACEMPMKALPFVDVVHFTYANNAVYLGNYTDGLQYAGLDREGPVLPEVEGKLAQHVPHGVDPTFKSNVAKPRATDVLLVGKVDMRLYPFRLKLHNWLTGNESITFKKDWHVDVRSHPGYVLDTQIHKSAFNQSVNYNYQLADSKIVLATPSARGFALRKYFEAAMAGALVVGPLPSERARELGTWIVPLDPKWPWAKVESVLVNWLVDEEARLARARLGQWYVLSRCTWQHSAHSMIDGWMGWAYEFRRGLILQHDFHLSRPFCFDKHNKYAKYCGVDSDTDGAVKGV